MDIFLNLKVFLNLLYACFIWLFVCAYSYVRFKSPLEFGVIIVWFFPTLNKAYCIVLYHVPNIHYDFIFFWISYKKKRNKLLRILNIYFPLYRWCLFTKFLFGDYINCIYPTELEIKVTTDTDRSASYLDLYPKIDSEGLLRTKLYDTSDDCNFFIVKLPFICNDISHHFHLRTIVEVW